MAQRIAVYVIMISFLMAGTAFPRGMRGEGVSREDLPKTLRDRDISDEYLPAKGFRESARIDALSGNVVVIHRASGEAYFGEPGDVIYENDMLETLADSRCRLRFLNEDVVTMAAGTRFGVDEYRHDRKKGESTSLLSMIKGKAMFYAMRLFGVKKRRFTLKTPTAVAGVRGTKFGVQVYWVDDKRVQGSGIRVADRGHTGEMLLAQTGPQGQSFTDIFSEDGVIDINGQAVTPGTMYRGMERTVMPTPPGFVKNFEAETLVMEGEGTGPGQAPPGGEPSGEGGDDSVLGAALSGLGDQASDQDLADTILNATSTETGVQSEEVESQYSESLIAQGKTAGWASGLATIVLLNSSGGFPLVMGAGKGPFYVHGPNPLGAGPDIHYSYEVNHEGEPDYVMTLEEDPTGSSAKVTDFKWGPGIGSGSNDVFHYTGDEYKDANGDSYLKWGYWQDTTAPIDGKVGIGSTYHAVGQTIWHIEGNRTHSDYISYLQSENAVYSYVGEGKGVMVQYNGSTPNQYFLTGDFSMDINFGTRHIDKWELDLSDGSTHTLYLSSNKGTLEPDGEFDIHDITGKFNGTVDIDPNNQSITSEADAGGIVCGPKAQGVGGAYHAFREVDANNKYWAVGEFHANRTGAGAPNP